MNTLKKSIAASALIFAIAGPASAAVSSDISKDVNLAAGSGANVLVDVDGNTVTLTGYVEDTYALQQIETAAKENGATEVNNFVFRSR